MTLYTDLTALRASVLNIRSDLGNPLLRNLSFINPATGFWFLISPVPKFTLRPPSSEYPTNIDEIINANIWSTDIPRSYARETIDNQPCYIDAILINQNSNGETSTIPQGTLCRAQILPNQSGLKWEIHVFEEYFDRDEIIQDLVL